MGSVNSSEYLGRAHSSGDARESCVYKTHDPNRRESESSHEEIY
jgi:hypothetical protein